MVGALRLTAGALAVVSVLLLGISQFAPWAEVSEQQDMSFFGSSFNFDFEMLAYTWEAAVSFNGDQTNVGWYDADMDDSEGIGQIRAAPPLLIGALVLGLAGGTLAFVGARAARMHMARHGLLAASALVATLGVLLMATGLSTLWDGSDKTWLFSFYATIASCVLLLVATVLSFVAPREVAPEDLDGAETSDALDSHEHDDAVGLGSG